MKNKPLKIKHTFGRIKYWLFMRLIECLRHFSNHDLYLVAGQLHTRNTDPIDAWTLFQWLQQQNIPSRFIVNSNDAFYQEQIKEKGYKDIIVLNGERSTTQLLTHITLWKRARAFVMEWNLEIPFFNLWLKSLPDMQYVMLNHGICGLWTDSQFMEGFNPFNYINVSSENEKNYFDEQLPTELQGRCFIGGLPRFDTLRDYANHSEETEKVLFIMFTWRNKKGGMTWKELQKTDYWQGILSFLQPQNVERLRRNNIKIVMSLHHSLLRTISGVSFHPDITLVNSKDVRYWISHAHILLTDFSSVAFDFLFLNKPVVFWIPDLKDPTLDPKDLGYGSKVLSAIERRKLFFNTVDTKDEALNLIEYYRNKNFILEPEKKTIANGWMERDKDFSRHVYEGIEAVRLTKR